MKKLTLVLSAVILAATVANADTILMRNGVIKKGQIISENTFSYMFKPENGTEERIFKDQVSTVERTDVVVEPSPLLKQLEQEGYVSSEEMKNIESLTDEKKELILKLLEINGTLALLEKNKADVLSKAPIEEYSKVDQLLNIDEMVKVIIPIYAKHFKTQELKQITDFYESEAGRKVIDKTPQIMQEVVQATIQYFQKHLQNQ